MGPEGNVGAAPEGCDAEEFCLASVLDDMVLAVGMDKFVVAGADEKLLGVGFLVGLKRVAMAYDDATFWQILAQVAGKISRLQVKIGLKDPGFWPRVLNLLILHPGPVAVDRLWVGIAVGLGQIKSNFWGHGLQKQGPSLLIPRKWQT